MEATDNTRETNMKASDKNPTKLESYGGVTGMPLDVSTLRKKNISKS